MVRVAIAPGEGCQTGAEPSQRNVATLHDPAGRSQGKTPGGMGSMLLDLSIHPPPILLSPAWPSYWLIPTVRQRRREPEGIVLIDQTRGGWRVDLEEETEHVQWREVL